MCDLRLVLQAGLCLIIMSELEIALHRRLRSKITPKSKLPLSWRFTNLQPIKPGPTTSAERQKKAWGKAGKSLVMGWFSKEMTYKGENRF